MNKTEAKKILSKQINEFRKLSYRELSKFVDKDHMKILEIIGESGTRYQLEATVFWDDKVGGNLRVIVSIDDGGWRAFVPISEDFIIAPDGSFIDED
jgi:hypothetical protein